MLYWTVELLAHTDSVWLAHDRWLITDGSGWDQLHVGVLRSGALQSSDTFDLSDLDAARARHDELVAAHHSPADGGSLSAHRLGSSNASWHSGRRSTPATWTPHVPS